MNRPPAILSWLLLLTWLATAATFWKAPFPSELRLQHLPTAIGLIGLWVTIRRNWLGTNSVCCLLGFLWLHLIGARWIYSYVPYDQWTLWLTGESLSARMGWERNHYDRLVHFASGVLFVPPVKELLIRGGLQGRVFAALLSISVVLAIGAIYEVAEWQVAVIFAPEFAEAYNGQQGDLWDPQKDLALAGLGALLCELGSVVMTNWKSRSGRKSVSDLGGP
jgi:putative membrane protein